PRMLGERFRYLAGRRLLRRADLLIAVSNATAEDARRLRMAAPGRIRVIPEAAGPVFAPRQGAAARVKDRWSLGGLYLLFVGALDARKNPRALLQAWRTARLLHPGLQLVIAGDPGRQAQASMEGAVRLGRVDDEALADLYSAAGCLVFPSRYEGFGLPCVEAMACGCPVAAYRNSSLPEVVDGAGELVDDGDADALGRAAARLASEATRPSQPGLDRARKVS